MAVNMASHFRNLTNFEAFIPSTPILEYSPLGKVYIESWNVFYSGEKIDDFRQSFTDSDDDIVDTPQLNWSKFSAVAEIGVLLWDTGCFLHRRQVEFYKWNLLPDRGPLCIVQERVERLVLITLQFLSSCCLPHYGRNMQCNYNFLAVSLAKNNWSHSIYLI